MTLRAFHAKSFNLFFQAEAYIIQIQKYDVAVTQAATTAQTTPAKATVSNTSGMTAKTTSSVNNKKPNTPSVQSPKLNAITTPNTQGSITSSAKVVTPTSILPGVKSPVSALVQKTTVALTTGKTLTVQSALQNVALSSVAQTIGGNKVIQVAAGTQLKTVLPGQLRANPTTLIRPAAPGVATAQRTSLAQPVISLQRPVVPGQTAIKVNSVQGKTTPAVTASQGATPTQYALVRAQIPGSGGGPPQTVTFIRAISPGGQAGSGGATVTVTPQQMAALLRGQTTALKGAAQSQVRSASPSTQGSTTAGLSTIRPVVATTGPQANNSKVPVNKQIIQIAAAQLAANQASGSATSPGVPVVAKVNLAGVASSTGAVVSPAPVAAASTLPPATATPTTTALAQSKESPVAGILSSSSVVKSSNPVPKATVEQSKVTNAKPTTSTAPVSSVSSNPTVNTAGADPEPSHQVAPTQSKEVSETANSSSLASGPASTSDADSTSSSTTAVSEKTKEPEDTAKKESEKDTVQLKDANAGIHLSENQVSSQELSSTQGRRWYYYFSLLIKCYCSICPVSIESLQFVPHRT